MIDLRDIFEDNPVLAGFASELWQICRGEEATTLRDIGKRVRCTDDDTRWLVPLVCLIDSARMIGLIEGANEATSEDLLIKAAMADGVLQDDPRDDPDEEIEDPAYPRKFGAALAHMIMRRNVSWFDRHEGFVLYMAEERDWSPKQTLDAIDLLREAPVPLVM